MMFVEQPQLHWVWQADIIAAYSQSTSPPARGSAGARGTPLGPAVTVTSSSLAGHCCYVCCPSFPAPPCPSLTAPSQLPYSCHSRHYPLLQALHARTDCAAVMLLRARPWHSTYCTLHDSHYTLQSITQCTLQSITQCTLQSITQWTLPGINQCTLQSNSTVLSPSWRHPDGRLTRRMGIGITKFEVIGKSRYHSLDTV